MHVIAISPGIYRGALRHIGETFEIDAAELRQLRSWVRKSSQLPTTPAELKAAADDFGRRLTALRQLKGPKAVRARVSLQAQFAQGVRQLGLLDPAEVDTAGKLAAYIRVLAFLNRLYRDVEQTVQGSMGPDVSARATIQDFTNSCRLVFEMAERIGCSSLPALPQPPVEWERFVVFLEVAATAAVAMASDSEREALEHQFDEIPWKPSSTDAADRPMPRGQMRPASFFHKIHPSLPDRIRKAAAPTRKGKRVRSEDRDGVKLYSEVDVRRWWEESFVKFDGQLKPKRSGR